MMRLWSSGGLDVATAPSAETEASTSCKDGRGAPGQKPPDTHVTSDCELRVKRPQSINVCRSKGSGRCDPSLLHFEKPVLHPGVEYARSTSKVICPRVLLFRKQSFGNVNAAPQ